MARDLALKVNVDAPDSDYPYGRIKDDDGGGNGTPVDEPVYGDFHQFFAKMFAESALVYNNLPDNAYAGFQFYEALLAVINKHEDTYVNTDDDNGETLEVNVIGSGPWAFDTLVTNYSYRVHGKRCELDFNISLNVTDGAIIDQIKIPLPDGIVKDASIDPKYSARGFCALTALPTGGGTDYCICYINAIEDGTEGQRLVIRRADASADMSISTGATLRLKGHIDFAIE